jgi:hypothetical protein
MDYAKHLIERIESAPENDRVGVLSNELLREFHRGYPLDDLRRLLHSCDHNLVATAIWITSELGVKCRPLLDDVVPLLAHPVRGIRFWALDCIFWTLPQNGCDLARAFGLLNDPDAGVRRAVLDLLARVSVEQIEAAYRCPEDGALNPSQRNGLSWLTSDGSQVPEKIEANLKGSDPVLRKFGVVAAARLRKVRPEPLICASTVDDADVREFAARLLSD